MIRSEKKRAHKLSEKEECSSKLGGDKDVEGELGEKRGV